MTQKFGISVRQYRGESETDGDANFQNKLAPRNRRQRNPRALETKVSKSVLCPTP